MSEIDTMEKLLDYLSKPGSAETIEKLVQLMENIEKSGLLDLLIAITDPEVVDRLVHILVTPGLLRLLDNLDRLTQLADTMVDAISEEPDHTPTLSEILAALKNENVRRGLAKMLRLLEKLGQT